MYSSYVIPCFNTWPWRYLFTMPLVDELLREQQELWYFVTSRPARGWTSLIRTAGRWWSPACRSPRRWTRASCSRCSSWTRPAGRRSLESRYETVVNHHNTVLYGADCHKLKSDQRSSQSVQSNDLIQSKKVKEIQSPLWRSLWAAAQCSGCVCAMKVLI